MCSVELLSVWEEGVEVTSGIPALPIAAWEDTYFSWWAKTNWTARAFSFDLSHSVVFPQLMFAERWFPLQIEGVGVCHSFPLFASFYFLFTQATPWGWDLTHCSKLCIIRQLEVCRDLGCMKLSCLRGYLRCNSDEWVALQDELSFLYEVGDEVWGRRDEKIAFFFSANLGICFWDSWRIPEMVF